MTPNTSTNGGSLLAPAITPTDTSIVAGKLQINPTSFTITRTGGSNGGCDYYPSSQWVCLVHLKNIDAQKDVSYSTNTNPDTITVDPSTSNVPISPGETTSAIIMIPDMLCPAQAAISFKVTGGDTTVVHWTCTG
jgi:hypothetical protein